MFSFINISHLLNECYLCNLLFFVKLVECIYLLVVLVFAAHLDSFQLEDINIKKKKLISIGLEIQAISREQNGNLKKVWCENPVQ